MNLLTGRTIGVQSIGHCYTSNTHLHEEAPRANFKLQGRVQRYSQVVSVRFLGYFLFKTCSLTNCGNQHRDFSNRSMELHEQTTIERQIPKDVGQMLQMSQSACSIHQPRSQVVPREHHHPLCMPNCSGMNNRRFSELNLYAAKS